MTSLDDSRILQMEPLFAVLHNRLVMSYNYCIGSKTHYPAASGSHPTRRQQICTLKWLFFFL